MKNIPMIKSVMTPFPYSVGLDDTLPKAREMMALHGIAHLPVKDAGELVSVVTDNDIASVLASCSGTSEECLHVRDACEKEAYIVDLTERLDAVLAHMARGEIDCTLVVKQGRLVGIFTMRDACRCFGEWLRHQFLSDGGDDAA